MSENTGSSEKKRGLFNDYVERRDKDGNVIETSETKKGLSGKYVEHTREDGSVGYSEKKRGPSGDYIEHTDEHGNTTGYSEKKQGLFNDYVEESDAHGTPTGWSEEQQGLGTTYREHHEYSRTDSGSHSGGGSAGSDLNQMATAAGTAIGKTFGLLIAGIVGGALWLVYTFLRLIIMGCVNGYRHYKSLDIVRKIEHRKGMLAIAILLIVVLPLPTIAIYNNLSYYIWQRYIVDKSTLTTKMTGGWVIQCWRNGDEHYRGSCDMSNDNIRITLQEDKQIAPRIHLTSRKAWYTYKENTLQIDETPVIRHEGDDSDVIKRMLRSKTLKMLLIKDTDPNYPYPKEAPNSMVAITKLDNMANVYAKMEETFRERFKIKLPDNKTWLQ